MSAEERLAKRRAYRSCWKREHRAQINAKLRARRRSDREWTLRLREKSRQSKDKEGKRLCERAHAEAWQLPEQGQWVTLRQAAALTGASLSRLQSLTRSYSIRAFYHFGSLYVELEEARTALCWRYAFEVARYYRLHPELKRPKYTEPEPPMLLGRYSPFKGFRVWAPELIAVNSMPPPPPRK